MKKVTLYIATHNKTGLKYFGKSSLYHSTQLLQENYHGSGTYWKKHLKKHGDDVSIERYGTFSEELVEGIALKFSEDNDIVKSKEWANLIPENGLDGGHNMVGKTHTEETKLKISRSKKGQVPWMKGKKHSKESNIKNSIAHTGENNWMFGKKHTESTKLKMSKSAKGRKLSEEHIEKMRASMIGKIHKEDTKLKMSESHKNKPRVSCPHCGKTGNVSNMKRYHFEKCKLITN